MSQLTKVAQALRNVAEDISPGNPHNDKLARRILEFTDVWGENFPHNPGVIDEAQKDLNDWIESLSWKKAVRKHIKRTLPTTKEARLGFRKAAKRLG